MVALVSPTRLVFEVGVTRLRAARFREARNGPELVAFAEEDLATTVGQPDWPAALTDVWQRLSRARWARGPAFVGLASSAVLMKRLQIPPVPRAQQARLIAFEAQQAFPYPLADVAWGWTSADHSPESLAFWVAAARREIVGTIVHAAESAGVLPWCLEPVTIALARTRGPGAASSSAEVLIDGDEGGTTAMILDGGHSHVRRLPALLPSSGDPAARASNERVRDEFRRLIVQHLGRGGRPVQVVTACGIVPAEWLQPLIQEFTLSRPGTDREKTPTATAAAAHPRKLALIGLAHGAAERKRRTLNLLARSEARRLFVHYHRTGFQAAAVLLIAVFGFGALQDHARRGHLAEERDLLRAEIAVRQREQAVLAAEATVRDELNRALQQWVDFARSRAEWTQRLHDLHGAVAASDDLWLTHLDSAPPLSRAGEALDPPRRARGRSLTSPSVLENRAASRAPEALPAAGNERHPKRFWLSGFLLDAENDGLRVTDHAFARFREWTRRVEATDWVARVESERFDPSLPGMLHFELAILLNESAGQPRRPRE